MMRANCCSGARHYILLFLSSFQIDKLIILDMKMLNTILHIYFHLLYAIYVAHFLQEDALYIAHTYIQEELI